MINIDLRRPCTDKDFKPGWGLSIDNNTFYSSIETGQRIALTLSIKDETRLHGFFEGVALWINIPSSVEIRTKIVNSNQLIFYFKSSTDNLFHLYIVDTLTGNIIYEEHSINSDIYSLVISNNFITFAINKGECIFEWRCFSIRSFSYYPVNFKKLKHESFKELGIILATENEIDSIIINPKLEMIESKNSWNSGFFNILKNINK